MTFSSFGGWGKSFGGWGKRNGERNEINVNLYIYAYFPLALISICRAFADGSSCAGEKQRETISVTASGIDISLRLYRF